MVRGRSRSRSVGEILEEVKRLVDHGYKEVVLTGIHLGDFDGAQHPPATLGHLVRRMDRISGIKRIRLSSIDPSEVDEDLLDALLSGQRTCHSLHLVLQSGSDHILQQMRRKYTRRDFLRITDQLYQHSPSFTFSTDVIVGFPGETERDFEETAQCVKEVQFVKTHIFPYSDRPKTRASRMGDKVKPEIVRRRKEDLRKVAEEAAFHVRDRYVGRKIDVLVEGRERKDVGGHLGYSANFLPIFLPSHRCRPNELVTAYCRKNHRRGLIADVCEG